MSNACAAIPSAIVRCGAFSPSSLTSRSSSSSATATLTVSPGDDALGGLWAVVATVFLFRDSYDRSLAAAVSRMAATLVSFVLCLAYLALLPFSPLGLAILIAVFRNRKTVDTGDLKSLQG